MKNIIFDVGDVLIEYRWLDMLLEHGTPREKALRIGNTLFVDELWEKLDLGLISLEDAKKGFIEKYPELGDDIYWILSHGEGMAVKREDVWAKIPKLKEKGYSIYLLSNYSEELFYMHTKGASFLDVIDGGIISYQVHFMKPDERIYKSLFDKYGLKSEECLFLDDRIDNIEGGRAVGMEGIQITSKAQLLNLLDELINKQ